MRLLNEIEALRVAVGKAPAAGQVRKTYVIEAVPEVIDRLERFLAYVQWCAGVGHSTTVGMSIDGDGAERFTVISPHVSIAKGDDGDPDIRRAPLRQGGEVEIV